ncbi:MAG: CRISPR-associated helicase Cas3' [Anaerolineae bacterium]
MSERAANKADRLLQIEQLLLEYPEGLTQAEIARRIGVHRSTVKRYLPDLTHRFPIYDTPDGRIAIDRRSYLTEVRFTLHEALAVHLAARLMAKTTDKQNPHAASALRKLGTSLERLAPFISEHVRHAAEVMDTAAQRYDPVYIEVLEALTDAWSRGRKVALKHQMDDGRVFDYTFAPYYIEPYPLGRTSHVIGLREPPGAVRTFKIERIRTVEVLNESYTLPEDFNPTEHLADAWSIWTSEREPVEVVLRFHPRVVHRVQETRWHRNEQTVPQPDGSLIWRAPIAEPREMLPWIRGWGADVEVLAPEQVRKQVTRGIGEQVKVYSLDAPIHTSDDLKHLRCWGKTDPLTNDFHPAVFHMLDVANVARQLLGGSASPRWRNTLARALDVSPESLGDWLPYVVSLHDLGKISASFQSVNTWQFGRLKGEGFDFGSWRKGLSEHHTKVGSAILEEVLPGQSASRRFSYVWQVVIGSHHGTFAPQHDLDVTRARLSRYEPPMWADLRATAEQMLREQLLNIELRRLPEPIDLALATLTLSGFTILCDWLGSDERFFPPTSDVSWEAYAELSECRAARAVHTAGFASRIHSSVPDTYNGLFPDKLPPRPLQTAIDDIPDHTLGDQCLAIIEAPTGEGKTEAALTLAHRLAKATGTEEIYYALPTTATSNQMFRRLEEYLRKRLDLTTEVQLIHGQAHLLEDDLRAQPMDSEEETGDAIEWFTSKKRAILAPFGVGTIDQAELAALNVRHGALRLMGLAGKVVIFDEVHAYDTYMTTILETLLHWLSKLGTSVIMLSATLPISQRKRLAQAYNGGLPHDSDANNRYPSLLISRPDGTVYQVSPPAYQPARRLGLRTFYVDDEEPEDKARWLLDAVRDGGCACWITNTVDRAQRLFAALRQLDGAGSKATQGLDLSLIHARLPLEDRMRREQDLTAKYGPQGRRPHRGIVVGTQVLEQSLDLDFDAMVSDLAPIDLLLQRAGRLQRHDTARPEVYSQGPVLWIQTPMACGGDALGVDSVIYDEFLLKQTWAAIANLDEITLPGDYRPLVEAVYGDQGLDQGQDLEEAWEKLQRKESEARKQAQARLIPRSDVGRAFFRQIAALTFEEDETGAGWTVAQTRLGRESVNVVPLERAEGGACHLPDGQTVATDRAASPRLQLHILRQQLRVSRPEIVRTIKEEERPRLFNESARLRYVYPLWLDRGARRFPTQSGHLVVSLDRELGLVIRKESSL